MTAMLILRGGLDKGLDALDLLCFALLCFALLCFALLCFGLSYVPLWFLFRLSVRMLYTSSAWIVAVAVYCCYWDL
jgi:hypothetical protein